MKLLAQLACLFLATVSWSWASAAEPKVGKYVRYDAGDYVIVTSRGGNQARSIMEELARFRAALELMLGKRATKNTTPTVIVITSSADWKKWLQPRQLVEGFFQRGRFSNYLALNGDAPLEETLHLVFHEFTHYYLASRFAGEYPPWFNEGMAEVMGYVKFDKGMAILLIPTHLVVESRDGDWIPFERMIRVKHTDPEYQSHKLGPAFYAQSWLTVHYGLLENRAFGTQIFQYLAKLNTLMPQDEAARTTFGNDLSVIDKQLRDYSRNRKMMSGGIQLGDLPPVTLAEGKPSIESDTLDILADVLLGSNFPPDRIRPLVESLQRREPAAARSSILAARLALLDDDDAAFDSAVAKAEAALAPGDWLQRRELGTALLTSSDNNNPLGASRKKEDAERDDARALEWFAEAIEQHNADVESLWGFGTAATRLNKDLDRAEQALVTAYKLAPWSADIAMSLVNLKAQQQKPDEMIPFLHDVIRLSTNLGMRSWAADTLVDTKEYIAERDKVEAENQKRREEYEKQRAEYEKKYGKNKKAKP